MTGSSSSHVSQHEGASKMKTMSDVESWLYACEEDPAPPPPSPIPPSSPKWETPKAHLKRQKKRNQREEKAAQRAKAALRSKITVKLPKQNSNLNGDMMEKEDLCHACPIFAPHRTGVYAYGSPELPKKILIIQAKIAKAKATEDDIKLHNAFAAVHANFALGQPHPVPESANAGDDGLGIQTSDLKKPQQGSQCQHPECPVKASHRSGNTSRPNKIKNVTAKITKGTATEDDFQLLAGYFAVHSPGEDDEGGATSPESVEIIC